MSKSQLTKEIESALSRYSPASLDGFEFNYRRGQYMEFEVPCTHSHIEDGLVDAVWLAEGFNNHHTASYCSAVKRVRLVEHLTREMSCSLTEDELRTIPVDAYYPCLYEGKCFWKRQFKNKEEAVSVICFEIKISRADFKSPNGHNFIGNLNYYVMPYELFKQVESEIPEHIGVITYHPNDTGGRLIRKKSSQYNPIVDEKLYNSLLLTVVNKKDKQITKLKRSAREAVSAVEHKAESVVKKLIEDLKQYIPPPEEDCYKPHKWGCSNCTPVQIRCGTCPYGSEMQRLLMKKIDGRELLVEHYSNLL